MSDIYVDNRFEIIEAYKKKLIEYTNIESSPEEMAVIDNILFRFWQMGWLPDAHPEQQKARIFQGIIVEYLTISTHPEYEGKPYFSIKYTEDGQDFIGYGTYKPDVLSEFLKEYFMTSAEQQPTIEPEQRWIPCSERMPEYGAEVLTINTDGDYEINHIIDEEDSEWFYDGVIAWMPLPEGYKGGGVKD